MAVTPIKTDQINNPNLLAHFHNIARKPTQFIEN